MRKGKKPLETETHCYVPASILSLSGERRLVGQGVYRVDERHEGETAFAEHYQPHLPTDFGFYDLRVRETRRDQIKVAKKFGIDGFCYHYYWFSGKRLLDLPVDDMLADRESDMPFCLCWANENWTRKWDASEKEILIAQEFGPEDDSNFIDSLLPFFHDDRYIRVGNAPLLIVYRPQHLPDPKKSIDIWRRRCRENGIENIYVVAALTHGNDDHEQYGFDAGVQFPPHNLKESRWSHEAELTEGMRFHQPFSGHVYDFPDLANFYLTRSYENREVFLTVSPSWDNTARMGDRALVFLNGTPRNYEHWLSEAVKKTIREKPEERQLVFINAWNEWAEGCHLEPDRKHGRGFLEATLRVKQGESKAAGFADKGFTEEQMAYFAGESAVGSSSGSYGRSRSRTTFPKIVRELKRLGRQLRRLAGT